jgi:hypothetical protein
VRQTGESNESGRTKPEGDGQRHDTQQGIQAVRRDALGVERQTSPTRTSYGFIRTDEAESEATFEGQSGERRDVETGSPSRSR